MLFFGCSEDEGEFFYDEEEVFAGADAGTRSSAVLGHLDAMLEVPSADHVGEVKEPYLHRL
jgi:hypothetical protein